MKKISALATFLEATSHLVIREAYRFPSRELNDLENSDCIN